MDKNSEQHRKECEARHLLRTMNAEQRQAYYQGVESKRGEKAVDDLVSEVKRQRRLSRVQEVEI